MVNPVATAACFTWLGMVPAISFLEAPLKFRAPGVTVPIGLGIGRIVFRALNAAEIVLAIAVMAAVLLARPRWVVLGSALVPVALLAGQLCAIRPWLGAGQTRCWRARYCPARGHTWAMSRWKW